MASFFKALFHGLLRRSDLRFRSSQSKQKVNGWRVASVAEEPDYHLLQDKRSMKGSGCVYWGQLKDGTQIAVKRLDDEIMKGVEEFSREAEALGRIRHKNLLNLRGYCAEGHERMVVYDFMHNLSLFAHLHGDLAAEGHLDWQKRMTIAAGCAEGLAHLHNYSDPQLVHGDVKSSNVLLNSNYEPRLVDFGMCNFVKEGERKSKGAIGYIAPEDVKGDHEASKRSDIFSYGILLLELITGRNPAEKVDGGVSKLSLVEWAQSLVINGSIDTLVDPKLEGKYNGEELERLLNAAIKCAQDRPENRFSMPEVVELLKQGHC